MKEAEVHLKIGRSFESIPLVGVAVNAIARHSGLDELVSSQIELAVVEAINNAVEHSPDLRDFPVEIIIKQLPDKLAFYISDAGQPRSGPLGGSLPADPLAEGGYGLFLINEISDHAEWTERDGQNCLHFWKTLKENDSA